MILGLWEPRGYRCAGSSFGVRRRPILFHGENMHSAGQGGQANPHSAPIGYILIIAEILPVAIAGGNLLSVAQVKVKLMSHLVRVLLRHELSQTIRL